MKEILKLFLSNIKINDKKFDYMLKFVDCFITKGDNYVSVHFQDKDSKLCPDNAITIIYSDDDYCIEYFDGDEVDQESSKLYEDIITKELILKIKQIVMQI